ncbi:type II toxin-antitoxin system RelE/ParE family toxin [Prolixibacter denitrificans]|uniref:Plasmid stabilization system protein ParE n=1 Tax=Prolixibacter denitrificans TaxID=1541063 RepID=A0A2P8CFK3_9BACT|nr:plasmid stabilization protein [Prolixibacter denitrificans]PSK83726.1 plasmid stabilization system protein ParE [Prolixibacter denitrificans]GET23270.1 hypothetical protein JCM18694_35160 [Prolixibacter denitrificans]
MDSDIQIIWTSKAKHTYFKVLDYLEQNWTQKEIIQFNRRISIVLRAIQKNPSIFKASTKYPNIRKAIVDKNNSIFYTYDSYRYTIFLLTFFDNRQNPKTLRFNS